MTKDPRETRTEEGGAATKARPAEVVTFGCRLNVFESEVMREATKAAGLTNAFVINTCAVTAEATRQARQNIRKLRREHPDAQIIVTGCAAQITPERFADMPEVDQVLGNQEKLKAEFYQPLPSLRNNPEPLVRVDDIMTRDSLDASMVEGLEGRTRAFVQVQNGCDHRCTYCIIPYGRGPSASIPQGQVVDQVKRLVDNGYPEVVLTGIDITSFGPDLPGNPRLGRVVEQILTHVPGLKRLRFGTLDPAAIDERLFELLSGEPRVMPHAHWSMQSGNDMILKRMKRRHLRQDAIDLLQSLRQRRPDMMFGADFITGFPTETEAMFEETLRFIDEAGLTFLHVFPFSPREGTPAAKMPQVEGGLIRKRAARLRARGEARLAAYFDSLKGRRLKVLVERADFGHTDHFARITLSGATRTGETQEALVTGARGNHLLGVIKE